jgi:hypothetical protein
LSPEGAVSTVMGAPPAGPAVTVALPSETATSVPSGLATMSEGWAAEDVSDTARAAPLTGSITKSHSSSDSPGFTHQFPVTLMPSLNQSPCQPSLDSLFTR